MKDYYQLELDDMVIALVNKDAEIESLQKKLDIATKTLKRIIELKQDFDDDPMNKINFLAYGRLHDIEKVIKQALKEIDDSFEKCDKSHFFPSKNVKG